MDKLTKISINISIAIIICFIVLSCASVSVLNDPNANYKSYKTFAWKEPDVQVGNNPKYKGQMIDKIIRSAIEKELIAKGIDKNETNPDVLISYHTFTEQKTRQYGNTAMYPYGGWGWGYGWGFPYRYGFGAMYGGWPTSYSYTQGTLVIDIIDYRSNDVVWTGTVDGDIENSRRIRKLIEKGVHAIINKLPQEMIQKPVS